MFKAIGAQGRKIKCPLIHCCVLIKWQTVFPLNFRLVVIQNLEPIIFNV